MTGQNSRVGLCGMMSGCNDLSACSSQHISLSISLCRIRCTCLCRYIRACNGGNLGAC